LLPFSVNYAYIIKIIKLIVGSGENSWFCFPTPSIFPDIRSKETSIIEGKQNFLFPKVEVRI